MRLTSLVLRTQPARKYWLGELILLLTALVHTPYYRSRGGRKKPNTVLYLTSITHTMYASVVSIHTSTFPARYSATASLLCVRVVLSTACRYVFDSVASRFVAALKTSSSLTCCLRVAHYKAAHCRRVAAGELHLLDHHATTNIPVRRCMLRSGHPVPST